MTTQHPPIFNRIMNIYANTRGLSAKDRLVLQENQRTTFGRVVYDRSWIPLEEVEARRAYWRGFSYMLALKQNLEHTPSKKLRRMPFDEPWHFDYRNTPKEPTMKKMYVLIHMEYPEAMPERDIIRGVESHFNGVEGVEIKTILSQTDEEENRG